MHEHYARVVPIVGNTLSNVRVGIHGFPHAMLLVRYLAACGVRRWVWDTDALTAATLAYQLEQQHGAALDLDLTISGDVDDCDLVIGVGDAIQACDLIPRPLLLIAPPTAEHACHTRVVLPDDRVLHEPMVQTGAIDAEGWNLAAPLCAGLARALLLRDTPYRREDLAQLWAANKRDLWFEHGADPRRVWTTAPEPLSATWRTPSARRGTVLVVGLGSLGSVAALALTEHVQHLIIADPDRVDGYNPVRQAYSVAQIGQLKATALRSTLLAHGVPQVTAIGTALDEQALDDLLQQHAISAALVATGTAADFALARILRRADVPHVVGRCYPRARYWEAIVVDGQRGPAYEDIRGYVLPAPVPAPTPEQRAAYSDAGALEAEPATLIESGWAALWMARLLRQMMLAPGLRERWVLELVANQATCLVGGVGVESTAQGVAYGVELPGEVHAWVHQRSSGKPGA